jgi:hypothetical protein
LLGTRKIPIIFFQMSDLYIELKFINFQ